MNIINELHFKEARIAISVKIKQDYSINGKTAMQITTLCGNENSAKHHALLFKIILNKFTQSVKKKLLSAQEKKKGRRE